jgi:hypothetical protein
MLRKCSHAFSKVLHQNNSFRLFATSTEVGGVPVEVGASFIDKSLQIRVRMYIIDDIAASNAVFVTFVRESAFNQAKCGDVPCSQPISSFLIPGTQ